MAYAIDLSERQSIRTLQQAIRHQAALRLFPRTWEDERCLICHLASEDEHHRSGKDRLLVSTTTSSIIPFHAVPDDRSTSRPANPGQNLDAAHVHPHDEKLHSVPTLDVTPEEFSKLRGVYCDGQLFLGDNRYLFCSDVVGVEPPGTGRAFWLIHLFRPNEIQVMQRRRFWRFRPARSSRVEMRWRDDYGHKGVGIGWLCNISPDGIACRTDAQFSDHIFIGMKVTMSFKLDPTSDELFTMDCIVCNKMPAGTSGKFVIGTQFVPAETGPARETVECIRRHLLEMKTMDRHASKGADT